MQLDSRILSLVLTLPSSIAAAFTFYFVLKVYGRNGRAGVWVDYFDKSIFTVQVVLSKVVLDRV